MSLCLREKNLNRFVFTIITCVSPPLLIQIQCMWNVEKKKKTSPSIHVAVGQFAGLGFDALSNLPLNRKTLTLVSNVVNFSAHVSLELEVDGHEYKRKARRQCLVARREEAKRISGFHGQCF